MKSQILHKIGFYIILGTAFILPLFFLPVTTEYYDFNKNYLLLISAAILLFLWVTGFVLDRQVKIIRSPLGLPVLAFLISWLISTYTRTPNRLDALVDAGQTGTVFAVSIFFFTATAFVRSKKQLESLVTAIIGSFSLLAVFSILWGTGLMSSVIPWSFAKFNLWTPTGNSILSLVAYIILIPFTGILIFHQKAGSSRTLALSISLFLLLSAAGISTYRIFRDSAVQPLFLSQQSSWVIAMDALKTSPLLGTGANTYLIDFTRFRPLSDNLGSNWNVRFNSASNYYLHLLTTLGLLGLVAFIAIAVRTGTMLIKSVRLSSGESAHTISLAAAAAAVLLLVSFFLIPPGIVTLFLFYLLLAIIVISYKVMGSSLVHEANIDIVAASDTGIRTPILPWVLFLGSLALILSSGTPIAKAYLAEISFRRSLSSINQNDARGAYEQLNSAILLNPARDGYRIAASQTYLLLANSTAAKPELTADDRTLITQLVQKSIQEAKNAVALNPTKAANYENLASVYQNLLNFAEGADQWAVASYQQAISLNPTNPGLRVSLGGIFYARKNYDEALRLFLQAADLKPDYANAFYNISAVYREKKDYQNAYKAMQQVVNIIDKTSADYTKAKGELDTLAGLIGSTAEVPAEPAPTELETAKPLPTPKVNPPIELPAELGPETTPSPAPTRAPSPVPAP